MTKVPILQPSIWLALVTLLAYPFAPQSIPRRMLIGEISRDITQMTPEEKWKPVDCPHLLDLVNDEKIYDPNKQELFARWTTTNPPFFIAMNTWWYDLMRKIIYDDGEYYERTLTRVFQKILKYAPANSRVVDVGGNIGWFTLLSASMGHHVDVFEPNTVNVIRQCQSMKLNGWSNIHDDEVPVRTTKQGSINIRQYGVGSNTTTLPLYIGKNPGKATLVRDMIPKRNLKRDGSFINIVTLDSMAQDLGWFDPNNKASNIVILKVDVEGFEPSVFAGATKLLRSGLIENILMEVSGQNDNSDNEKMLKLIVDAGYYLHDVGGPDGPTGKQVPTVSDGDLPKTLLASFVRKQNMQVNLWWKWKSAKPAP